MNLPMGSCEVPDRFSVLTFIEYKKKQTNSQAKYIYIYIDIENQLKLEELKFIPLINITINPVLKNPGINPAFIVFTVKERK